MVSMRSQKPGARRQKKESRIENRELKIDPALVLEVENLFDEGDQMGAVRLAGLAAQFGDRPVGDLVNDSPRKGGQGLVLRAGERAISASNLIQLAGTDLFEQFL